MVDFEIMCPWKMLPVADGLAYVIEKIPVK